MNLIDDLTYACYAYNRRRSPSIAPCRWELVFPDWRRYEERLITEKEGSSP